MTFDRHASLGYQANLLARVFAQALARRIAPLGITPGEFPVLLALWAKDERPSGALSREIGIEAATLTRTLDRMVRDGLVERRRSTADRRSVVVSLTVRGQALEAEAVAAAEAVNDAAAAGLNAGQRTEALRMMTALIANLSEDHPASA